MVLSVSYQQLGLRNEMWRLVPWRGTLLRVLKWLTMVHTALRKAALFAGVDGALLWVLELEAVRGVHPHEWLCGVLGGLSWLELAAHNRRRGLKVCAAKMKSMPDH